MGDLMQLESSHFAPLAVNESSILVVSFDPDSGSPV